MRFNSYEFLFLFLPLIWLGWQGLMRTAGYRVACGWLALGSLGFYCWWDWRYGALLVFSLMVNYAFGQRLVGAAGKTFGRRALLVAGLIWNVGLLGYFKYRDFFATNVNLLFDTGIPLLKLALPLGISFFTFQKVAFLVDAYQGKIRRIRFDEFALFVLFFPQLIAGPIVHHGDFIPQLQERSKDGLGARRIAVGLTVFAMGLFQKCVVADTIAPIADSAFGLSAQGTDLRMQEAWAGVMAYTLQLVFDFSGYSHMALGLALLFGLRLPVNFLAPYRSQSVIEFWRRWHMTLSAFLRDYIYIPMGGNRLGTFALIINLSATMLIGGFWHGAGWTFLVWGAWHALALCINHVWAGRKNASDGAVWWTWPLTMLVVMIGWVFFRAQDLTTAWQILQSLAGKHGISVPVSWYEWTKALEPVVRPRGFFPNITVSGDAFFMLVAGAASVACGPRLLAWCGVTEADVTPLPKTLRGELAPEGTVLNWRRACVAGALLAIAIAALGKTSPFLYFQF